MQYTFALVKSNPLKRGQLSSILMDIHNAGFKIEAEQFRWMNLADVEFLYAAHVNKDYYPNLWDSVRRGSFMMALYSADPSADVVGLWRLCMTGQYDGVTIKGPSLRDKYKGHDNAADNALHGSDSPEAAARELHYFFPTFALNHVGPVPSEVADVR